ncbi:MAG: hypothetical protein WCF33_14055 [Pseudonocardiaceae bacterium]
MITETRRLDQRTTIKIATAVQASDSTLTQLCGIANLVASKILAWSGSIPPIFAPPAARATGKDSDGAVPV